MSIPTYDEITKPLLQYAKDEQPHSTNDSIATLADIFQLTKPERDQLLPSGKQEVFANRVGWARTHLKKAGLVESTDRGFFCITKRGLEVLKENPTKINPDYLMKFPEYIEFKSIHREKGEKGKKPELTTPKEQMEYAYLQIVEELEEEVLQKLKQVSPKKFEHIVIDLLVAMNYGGNRQDAAKAIGGPGDEGFDGVINEDKLGINKIYVQAKRWDGHNVRHVDIRNFIGSLDVAHADKGVIITTSGFNDDALEAVVKSSKKIVSIDGQQLAHLMVENNIGTSQEDSWVIKKLDTDYFID